MIWLKGCVRLQPSLCYSQLIRSCPACAGAVNDMDATVAAIVNASTLPLSVLIVGVGRADFSLMQTLDADDRRLSSGGRVAARDIVQFVALKDALGPYPDVTPDVVAKVGDFRWEHVCRG